MYLLNFNTNQTNNFLPNIFIILLIIFLDSRSKSYRIVKSKEKKGVNCRKTMYYFKLLKKLFV